MNTRGLCIAGAVIFVNVSLAAAQEVLPKPEEAFTDAKIGRTYKDSKPGTINLTKAPAGAPNVLIILIDDAGFGQWGTFGGQVPTPNLDRLAKMGLRYTRFHTTALCSPTRAALLTGRNHHSAGTGVITEIGDGFPGYTGQIPKSAAMVCGGPAPERVQHRLLRQEPQHRRLGDQRLRPVRPLAKPAGLRLLLWLHRRRDQSMAARPLHGTIPVEMEVPPGRGHYTLNESLADKAIHYIHQEKSVTPDRPFFIYFAPGATHAPHHVPEGLDRQVQGPVPSGLGQVPRGNLSRVSSSRASFRPARSSRPAARRSRRGLPSPAHRSKSPSG